ncbi:hypothetical protein DPEC_G00364690 [Dallia pectoralis]|nr:hypothetical protein DPEC_G00364690 [Dallia pectoralis]
MILFAKLRAHGRSEWHDERLLAITGKCGKGQTLEFAELPISGDRSGESSSRSLHFTMAEEIHVEKTMRLLCGRGVLRVRRLRWPDRCEFELNLDSMEWFQTDEQSPELLRGR